MWARDKHEVGRIIEQCGSVYGAVNHVAKTARKLAAECDEQILDSHALSWAITGVKPELSKCRKPIKLESLSNAMTSAEYLEDILCYIDDNDMRTSVMESYRCSITCGHLIYFYTEGLDESQKSRVRILTNMVWDYSPSL